MRGFGPLSELTRDMSPADRAEVERIKADMRREGERLAAAGQVEPGCGPQAGRESGTRPGSAVTGAPRGALKDSAGTGR